MMLQNKIDVGCSICINDIERLDRLFLSVNKTNNIQLSMQKVTKIDSSGLALLLTWKKRMADKGFVLQLVDCTKELRECAAAHRIWALLVK